MIHRTTLSLIGLTFSTTAGAATFNVNTTVDFQDSTLGDCICQGTPIGGLPACSLRAAVMESNNCAGAPHQINVPAGTYNLVIAGAGMAGVGDLDILAGVTITGASETTTIVDGLAMGDRVFDVGSGTSLTLESMTVRKGATGGPGGCIRSAATLSLDGVTVKQCTSSAGAGGGISSTGTLTLAGSTVSHSSSAQEGGGIQATGTTTLTYSSVRINTSGYAGGGIHNTGTLTLTNTGVHGNTSAAAYDGGGVYTNSGSTTTLTNSTFKDNTSGNNGGGLYGQTAVTATGCDFDGNTATADGGGLYAVAALDLATTTVQENTAVQGGGVYAEADLSLDDTTIYNNLGTGDGGGVYTEADLTIEDTVFEANNAANGGGVYALSTVDVTRSTITSNHADSGDGGGFYLDGATATIDGSDIWENDAVAWDVGDGGGFYLDAASLDIQNSTVDSNTARYNGGGMNVQNGATVTAHHVTLSFNETINGDGGGFYGDTYTFSDSIIEYNNAVTTSYDECRGAPTSADYNSIRNLNAFCTWTAASNDLTLTSAITETAAFVTSATPGQNYRMIDPAGSADGNANDCTGTEQLGAARTSPCDRGAVEQ